MSNIRKTLVKKPEQGPCTGIHLEKLVQPAILALLARDDLHGYKIVQELGKMPIQKGEKPDCTGVYRQLKSFEARGKVKSTWDLSGTGPAKRSFTITPAGVECLKLWIKTLKDYSRGLASLLEHAQKAVAGKGAGTRKTAGAAAKTHPGKTVPVHCCGGSRAVAVKKAGKKGGKK